MNQTPPKRPRPPRVTGAAHLLAATGYSLQGLRRLWQETALRHMALALPVCLGLFAVLGVGLAEYAVLAILFLLMLAVEALNTAIEVIIDHLAPDWAEFARDAKDLGSLATMCLIAANGVFVALVVYRAIITG